MQIRVACQLAVMIGLTVASVPLAAQSADSTPRFSLFGGQQRLDQAGVPRNLQSDYRFGGSADFSVPTFPLMLRASLAFSRLEQPNTFSNLEVGTFSVQAIARPLPTMFGVKPYFLGGLGVGTRAPFVGVLPQYNGTNAPVYGTPFTASRLTWTYVEGAAGLEFHRLFIQRAFSTPVASNGYTMSPISVGFRF